MPIFRPRTLVASAGPLLSSGVGDPGVLGKSASAPPGIGLADPRQVRAWDIYDRVGPVGYAMRYSANVMRRVRYFAAVIDPDNPDGDPVPGDKAAEKQPDGGPPLVSRQEYLDAQDCITRIVDDRAGQGEIIYQQALNLLVAGDYYVVAEPRPDGTERWAIYSVVAISKRRSGGMSTPGRAAGWWVPDESGRGTRELAAGTLIVRNYQPHPRDPRLGDSALMHVLDDCDEYDYLSRASRGAARSRLAGNGLFLVPSEIDIPPDPGNADEMASGRGSVTSLLRMLGRAMAAAIKDERSPSSHTPFLLQGPGEKLQYARHVTFDRPMDKILAAQRDNRLKVIAVGLDLPQERLSIEGLADNNHWSGAQVAENEWNGHLAPLDLILRGNWASTLLRPMMAALGYGPDVLERWTVGSDPTAAIEKPDKSANAQQGHDRFVISDAALRKYSGFDEDDAPTPEELADQIERVRLSKTRSMSGPEQIPSGDVSPNGTGGSPAPPPEPVGGPSGDPGQTAPVRASAARTSDRLRWLADMRVNDPGRLAQLEAAGRHSAIVAASNTRRRALGTQLADLDERLLHRVLVGADAALRRELDRAGARVQQAAANRGLVAGGRRAAKATLSAIPKRQIAAHLGRAAVEALIASGAAEPFDDGAFDEFSDQVDGWVADTNDRAKELVVASAAALANRRDQLSPITSAVLGEWQSTQARNAELGRATLKAALLDLAGRRLFDPDPRVDDRGEYDSDLSVPASTVRPALAAYGGSSTSGDGSGGQIPFGVLLVAGGATMLGLARTGNLTFVGYEWRHGNPLHPFEPHENLDGMTFDNFDDASLSVGDSYAWIESLTGGYYPGDHPGCTCLVGIIFGEGADL